MRLGPDDPFPGEEGSVADVLLRIHRSYLAALSPVLDRVHALAHVTGGGLPGNLDRALPPSLDAVVRLGSWEVPPVFRERARAGEVAQDEMFRAFNMGVGMVALGDPADADALIGASAAADVPAWILGEVTDGSGRVVLDGRATAALGGG